LKKAGRPPAGGLGLARGDDEYEGVTNNFLFLCKQHSPQFFIFMQTAPPSFLKNSTPHFSKTHS
jgi:hypothetical protein